MPTDEQVDAAYDNYKDREADDHLGIYDDDDEAWERRAGATLEDNDA